MTARFLETTALPARAVGCMLALLLVVSTPLWAQSASPAASGEAAVATDVMVRVRANDAKLLQDPVGGARVTSRNADTGAELAKGQIEGGSGSTDQIMREPHARGASIYDTPGAAGYRATLQLDRPTRVEITAEGPLDYPQAMQRASTTMWLVPGQDVLGDGVVLTLYGFIVEITEATPTAASAEAVNVHARVRMLCGCPTEPGGMWDASRYTITAQLLRDGAVVAETPMQYAGTTNHYEGAVRIPDQENATAVRVIVSDAERVNFGVATKELSGE